MEFITIESWPPVEATDYRPALEAGNVLFFPKTPFPFSDGSQQFLRQLNFSGGAIHKNIAYRPALDKVTGVPTESANIDRLRSIMREYSQSVIRFTAELLPEYAKAWKLDYASFRPVEEENRNLPVNKRNDLIHTDAFPSRPTNGDLILRVFTNIHPSKTRNWITTDPFRAIAEKYADDAGLRQIAASSISAGCRIRHQSVRMLHGLGLPVVPRSAYDRFMLQFHEYLKRNENFQEQCPKYRFNFPPGSTWLTFTDLVPHSVHSGQHALEQTFIIARKSMADSANSPVSILEGICGKSLLERG
ncbi:MAG TPA: Kdo hydroxylase family protein [Bryobacteraceae bacterium]|nr:Kdo hydroxylase family protein [Bryobacteraceae bacterium]